MSMKYSIGVDIGGTNTDIGLVSSEGKCIGRKNLPTDQYDDAAVYIADIWMKINETRQQMPATSSTRPMP